MTWMTCPKRQNRRISDAVCLDIGCPHFKAVPHTDIPECMYQTKAEKLMKKRGKK
jgi:hypothetical protein